MTALKDPAAVCVSVSVLVCETEQLYTCVVQYSLLSCFVRLGETLSVSQLNDSKDKPPFK